MPRVFLWTATCLVLIGAPALAAGAANNLDLLALDPEADAFAHWRQPDLVPEDYFHRDLRETFDNGLNHTAQFLLPASLRLPILVLENPLRDGERHPVTLSIGDGRTWRNFIVGFDASGSLDLSLGRVARLAAEEVDGKLTRGEKRHRIVRVISGSAFEAHLFDGERSIATLEVRQPQPVEPPQQLKAFGDPIPPLCCGPNMGFNYRRVRITAENGVSVLAWATMSLDQLNTPPCHQVGSFKYCQAVSTLRIDYPNIGERFHAPDFFRSPVCNWSFDINWPLQGFCSTLPYYGEHGTSTNNPACLGTQQHTWDNMAFMLDYPAETGTATAISGCQTGGTWTVQRVN